MRCPHERVHPSACPHCNGANATARTEPWPGLVEEVRAMWDEEDAAAARYAEERSSES